MSNLIVLVTGDRRWRNRKSILEVVRQLNPEILVHGSARGADSLADSVAEELGIWREKFPARWEIYGRGAGPIRNREMLDYILDFHKTGWDILVVAFTSHIERSSGTANMLQQTHDAGLDYVLIEA